MVERVLYYLYNMVPFSPSIEKQKQFIIVKLKIWVWCSRPLHVYRHLLTNRLHGKAAELCLASSEIHPVH